MQLMNLFSLVWKNLKKDANNEPDNFDQQIKTLLVKKYDKVVGPGKDKFLDHLDPLRKIFQPGDIIVITKQIVSLANQMSLAELDGKTGYVYIDTDLLKNAEEIVTPTVPYLIRDIEDGSALRNCSFSYCLKQFAKQKRSGLTAEEGIALIIQRPEILKKFKLNLLGSRCGASYIPCLEVIEGRPALGYNWLDGIGLAPGWAVPSCGSRLSI